MEHWVEYEKNNKDKINKADELINIQEIILSDYERVLKENEILKEEKEQAWEEWNNLEQGSHETEQKLKQQIKKLQKENELAKKQVEYDKTHIYTPQTIKLNYIPIQKVKDKIEEIQEEGYWLFTTDRDSDKCVEVLQELLENNHIREKENVNFN